MSEHRNELNRNGRTHEGRYRGPGEARFARFLSAATPALAVAPSARTPIPENQTILASLGLLFSNGLSTMVGLRFVRTFSFQGPSASAAETAPRGAIFAAFLPYFNPI